MRHTLNTIGQVSYNAYDEVWMDVPDCSGHGFTGAEEYDVILPRHIFHDE